MKVLMILATLIISTNLYSAGEDAKEGDQIDANCNKAVADSTRGLENNPAINGGSDDNEGSKQK